MFIVHVAVRVKPEFVAAFREATVENARQSLQEPGVARFDAVQQRDDGFRGRNEIRPRGVALSA